MNLQLAVFLAALSSALLSTGLYLMKREAPRMPALRGGLHLRAWLAFLRNPSWLAGVALQTGGYAIYLAVLRFAPLSLVHTALTGGLVLFLLLAVFVLGEHAGRRERGGGALIAVGLVLLGLSLDDNTPSLQMRGLRTFVAFHLAAAAAALMLDTRPGRPVGYAVASGVILGLAGMFAKVLAIAPSLPDALLGSALWLTLATNIAGFGLMQSALQNGRGVVVVPIFSVLSDLVPIAAGLIVFAEPLPAEPGDLVCRLLAFVFALAGAALLATATEPHTASAAPAAPGN